MRKAFFYLLAFVSLLIVSCEEDLESPTGDSASKLKKGFAWEVLEERGNYSMFLKAADTAGYYEALNGKGLATVFAPDDEAFKRYLSQKGYSAIEDMPMEELRILIGQHILKYSYRKSDLLNFQPTTTGVQQMPGVCYKHRSFAKADVDMRYDSWEKKWVKVLNREKYVPVFSTELFETLDLKDPEYNYKYFYPDSKWYGTEELLYPANAGVVEYEVPTDNGYIYFIDNMIEPMRTVNNVLEDEKLPYHRMSSLFHLFENYSYNKDISDDYTTTGDSLYLFTHMDEGRLKILNLGSEWITNSNNTELQKKEAFNAFIPNDEAINKFFNDFFNSDQIEERYKYTSLEEVDRLTLFYLLQNHLLEGNPLFPEMVKGGIDDIWGGTYEIDPDQVRDREICNNGVFYGIDRVLTPAIFKGVTKPVFQSKKYKIFAYMLMRSGILPELTNPERKVTFFPLSDEYLEANNYGYKNGENFLVGDEVLYGPSGDWSAALTTDFISNYIVYDEISPEILSDESGKTYYFETANKDHFIKIINGHIYPEFSAAGEDNSVAVDGDRFTGTEEYHWRVYQVARVIEGVDFYCLRVIDHDLNPWEDGKPSGSHPYVDWLSGAFKEQILKKSNYFPGSQKNAYLPFKNNRGVMFMSFDQWTSNGQNGPNFNKAKLTPGLGIPILESADKTPMDEWIEKHIIRVEENGEKFKLQHFIDPEQLVGREYKTMSDSFNLSITEVEEGEWISPYGDGYSMGKYRLTIHLPRSKWNPVERDVHVYGPHFSKDAIFYVVPTAEDRLVWQEEETETEEGETGEN